MKTWTPKLGEVEKQWFVIDAKDKVLGRLAVECARILRGKHKPQFATHADNGDFVIVVNASQVKLTGRKMSQKMYYNHSGYPGGLKVTSAEKLMKEKPEELFRRAVKGMLPKNSLGRSQITKLKIYASDTHPHEAQKPEIYQF